MLFLTCLLRYLMLRHSMTYEQAGQPSPLFYNCSLFAQSTTTQAVSQCMQQVILPATAACSMLHETHTKRVAYHNRSSTLAVMLILDFRIIGSGVDQLIAVQYLRPSISYAWSHVAHDTLHLSFFATLYALLFVVILSLGFLQKWVSRHVGFGTLHAT